MWLEILICLLFLWLLDYLWKRDINAKFPKVSGPLSLPIIGCTWMFIGQKPSELLKMGNELHRKYGRSVKTWIFHIPGFFTQDLAYIQEILSHPVEIKKNRMYVLLTDWLGDGLLVSNGPKWLARRRAITPAFHFKILEEFVQIFDQQAQILVQKFEKHADGHSVVNVHDNVGLATLDIICETAMGVKINAQTDEQCEYVRLLVEMTEIIIYRFANLVYRSDFLFSLLSPKLAKRQQQLLHDLHEFTEHIIKERRQEMLQNAASKTSSNDSNNEYGIKPRMALLDILLSSTIDEQPLSNADIREEVDTFMFEGHDTTKSAIGFTLHCISRHPEVQQKLFAEICEIMDKEDGQKEVDELGYRQLMDLKYLEQVIKESLRMYPPVPFIGRQIMHDCKINGSCLPKGTSVVMGIMPLQNDPKYFPEPHKFLPERNQPSESAFTFVPFSAGPRNCIGQRFAMLEIKAIIARIIQRYELLPLGADVEPTITVVLKSKTGWQMGFRTRV